MIRPLLTLSFLIFLCDTGCWARFFNGLHNHYPKIIGGKNTTIEEHPHQLSLLYQNDGLICGATLIKPNLALTTAQCVFGSSTPKHFSIRAGSTYHNKDGTIVDVAAIKTHPKFSPITIEYDVAVLVLEKSLPLGPTIQTIPIQFDGEISDGAMGRTTGWGSISETGELSDILQEVDVPKVSEELCEVAYDEKMNITDSMICFGYDEGGKDACQGDAGGPVSVDGKQVGIVSWGNGCGRLHYPGVYARLSNKDVGEFIKKSMEEYQSIIR